MQWGNCGPQAGTKHAAHHKSSCGNRRHVDRGHRFGRRQTTAIREYVKGCSSARTRAGRTNNPATSIDTLFWRLSTRGRVPEFGRSTRRRIFALEGTAFHSTSVRYFRPATGEIERLRARSKRESPGVNRGFNRWGNDRVIDSPSDFRREFVWELPTPTSADRRNHPSDILETSTVKFGQ
jgi:hypothetical protein